MVDCCHISHVSNCGNRTIFLSVKYLRQIIQLLFLAVNITYNVIIYVNKFQQIIFEHSSSIVYIQISYLIWFILYEVNTVFNME